MRGGVCALWFLLLLAACGRPEARDPRPLVAVSVLPLAYFVLSIAHSGVRVGRKTYVVDLASGNSRTAYVSVSNTVIGVMLLVVGSLGALSPVIGNAGMIGLLAAMGVAGAALTATLKEV